MALTIVAQFQARPGMEAELETALKMLILPTRAESGCEVYELHRSLEQPGFFHFHEIWSADSYWEAHMRSPHIREFTTRSEELVAESRILQLEPVG
ncbi:MAG TPA: putative quinol monooxygenase [Candidatus Krumholzibacteria bacterium]|nr:putative quinol monooxygenase [Candidatus Krumholzibacteria bacterium]